MDWITVAKGVFMADLMKVGIAFGVLALAVLTWYIAYWMTK